MPGHIRLPVPNLFVLPDTMYFARPVPKRNITTIYLYPCKITKEPNSKLSIKQKKVLENMKNTFEAKGYVMGGSISKKGGRACIYFALFKVDAKGITLVSEDDTIKVFNDLNIIGGTLIIASCPVFIFDR